MWAPDINYFDGKYVMYYAISKWDGGATCGIGVGISDQPQGPYLSKTGEDLMNIDAWNPQNYQPVVLHGDEMFGGPVMGSGTPSYSIKVIPFFNFFIPLAFLNRFA